MKLRSWGGACTLVLFWVTSLLGGPLQWRDVAADATWVAHCDVDAMRSSSVIQAYCDELLSHSGVNALLDHFSTKFGMDPRKELHALTLYGTAMTPDQCVVMIRAEMDQSALLQHAQESAKYATSKHRDYQLHSWTYTTHGEPRTVSAAFPKSGVLVMTAGVKSLKAALDVLDGRRDHLTNGAGKLAAEVPHGTMFLVRATGISKSAAAEEFSLCSLLNQFDYVEGQWQGEWFEHVTIVAGHEEAARKVTAAIQGLKALFWLHTERAPELQQLIDQMQTTREGSVVRCDFRAPLDTLIAAAPATGDLLSGIWKGHHVAADKRHTERDKTASEPAGSEHHDSAAQPEREASQQRAAAAKKEKDKEKQRQTEAAPPPKPRKKPARKPAPADRPAKPTVENQPDEGQREKPSGNAVLGILIDQPSGEDAAEVVRVWPDSPAEKAGLQSGDRIVQLGDETIASPDQLRQAIERRRPGERVTLTIRRDGKQKQLQVRLGGTDAVRGRARPTHGQLHRLLSPHPWLGIQISPDARDGISVAGVVPGSPAARAGLEAGDVIRSVGDTSVNTPAELQAAVVAHKPGDTVRLVVQRDDTQSTIDVQLGAYGVWAGETDHDARRLLRRLLRERFEEDLQELPAPDTDDAAQASEESPK